VSGARRAPPPGLEGREIILEWVDHGQFVTVNAVDVETGVETSASGPRTATQHDLETLAMGKLARRLAAASAPEDEPQDEDEAARDDEEGEPGRGRLV
jgi:hypothetical protein